MFHFDGAAAIAFPHYPFGAEGGDHPFDERQKVGIWRRAVAKGLEAIQTRHPNVDVGSYPFMRSGKFGCTLVSRGVDGNELEQVVNEIKSMIIELGGEPIDQDLVTPEDEKSPDDY